MKRNNKLDFLRFLAILVVVVSHASIKTNSSIIRHLITPGYIGVELFFVLSGFLITGLIVNEYTLTGNFDPKLFLIRRGFKIYPPYYIFIFCASLYQIVKHKFILNGFLSDIFFFSNYSTSSGRAWFWSLSIEEHFYFLICFLSFFLISKKLFSFKSFIKIYLVFLFISFLFRIYSILYLGPNWRFDYQLTHSRLDSLFFGSITYFIWVEKHGILVFIKKWKVLIGLLATAILSLNYIFIREEYRILSLLLLSINSVCFGILVIITLDNEKINSSRILNYLGYLGKYSYTIYLIHPTFGLIMPRLKLLFPNEIIYIFIYLVLCFASGIIVSRIVEIPFLRLRERYFPGKNTSIV